MDRRQRLTIGLDVMRDRGVEIGPSINPVVPKSGGALVTVVDHTDADGLRAKYASHAGVDTSSIEEVDRVWDGGRLTATLHGLGPFRYIIASHVLEHLPNPLAFLHDCADVLNADGVLSLALPDHRMCFGHARPVTTVGQWIDALDADRGVHTAGAVVDHTLYALRRGESIGWSAGDDRELSVVHGTDEAVAALAEARRQLDYIDVHAWVFTPASFAQLIDHASALGLVSLSVESISDTEGDEFFVRLVKSPLDPRAGDHPRRVERMLATLATERTGDSVAPTRRRWWQRG